MILHPDIYPGAQPAVYHYLKSKQVAACKHTLELDHRHPRAVSGNITHLNLPQQSPAIITEKYLYYYS